MAVSPGPDELDSFTLSTRGSKTAASPEEVNAAWRALGEEHNQTAKRSEEAFHDWGLHADPNIDPAEELLVAVTSERSMITAAELRAKAYELSAGVCRPAEADRLIVELERSGELLRWRTAPTRPSVCAKSSRPRSRPLSAAPATPSPPSPTES